MTQVMQNELYFACQTVLNASGKGRDQWMVNVLRAARQLNIYEVFVDRLYRDSGGHKLPTVKFGVDCVQWAEWCDAERYLFLKQRLTEAVEQLESIGLKGIEIPGGARDSVPEGMELC